LATNWAVTVFTFSRGVLLEKDRESSVEGWMEMRDIGSDRVCVMFDFAM